MICFRCCILRSSNLPSTNIIKIIHFMPQHPQLAPQAPSYQGRHLSCQQAWIGWERGQCEMMGVDGSSYN